MSDNRPLAVLTTATDILDSGGASFVTALPASGIRLFSNRAFHVSLTGTATVEDLPVAANTPILLAAPQNGTTVSVCLASGETDGNVWFTSYRSG